MLSTKSQLSYALVLICRLEYHSITPWMSQDGLLRATWIMWDFQLIINSKELKRISGRGLSSQGRVRDKSPLSKPALTTLWTHSALLDSSILRSMMRWILRAMLRFNHSNFSKLETASKTLSKRCKELFLQIMTNRLLKTYRSNSDRCKNNSMKKIRS